mmetsp:Transcript_22792/g.57977  ORF Transcript_22792/g.57977 Transcript_22792/m.57977 type:complete len:221 (+) Transcript_22792:822-1484(+)
MYDATGATMSRVRTSLIDIGVAAKSQAAYVSQTRGTATTANLSFSESSTSCARTFTDEFASATRCRHLAHTTAAMPTGRLSMTDGSEAIRSITSMWPMVKRVAPTGARWSVGTCESRSPSRRSSWSYKRSRSMSALSSGVRASPPRSSRLIPKAKRRSRSWRTAGSSWLDLPGPHQSRRTTCTTCSSSKDDAGTMTSRIARSMRASKAVHAPCLASPPRP